MSDFCDEALAHLYTYIDGELDDGVIVERIQQHLSDCPPCGGAFGFEQRLKMVVRQHLAEDVPASLMDRLRSIVAEHRPE